MKKPGSGVETEPGLNFTTLVNQIAPVPPKAGLSRVEVTIIPLALLSQAHIISKPKNYVVRPLPLSQRPPLAEILED